MKLYRQVRTSERMPEKDGDYITEEGTLKFKDGKFWWDYSKTSDWGTDKPYDVDFWLEEIEIPNESAVTDYAKNEMLFNGIEFSYGFTKGYNFLLTRLKG